MNAQDRKAVSGIVSELEALRSQAYYIGTRLRELADAVYGRAAAIEEATSNLFDAADAAESGNIKEALDALGNLEE